MKRSKIFVAASVLALAGAISALFLWRESERELQRGEHEYLKNESTLARLEEERAQREQFRSVRQAQDVPKDPSAELAELRAETERLIERKMRLQEVQDRTGENGSETDPELRDAVNERGHWRSVISDSVSEEYRENLIRMASAARPGIKSNPRKDAQNLGQAVRKYAREHEGRFPTSFEVAAEHFWKDESYSNPRIEDFELLFEGTTNDLAGIPSQAFVLLRQRESWLTPEGKKARIYVLGDGRVVIVETDDDFRSWELEHVIPPP